MEDIDAKVSNFQCDRVLFIRWVINILVEDSKKKNKTNIFLTKDMNFNITWSLIFITEGCSGSH